MIIKRLMFMAICSVILFEGCATASQRRLAFFNSHPNLNQQVRQAILEGRILKGMTMEEVRASWGSPQTFSKSEGYGNVSESWYYPGSWCYDSPYLGFDNGVLTYISVNYTYLRGCPDHAFEVRK